MPNASAIIQSAPAGTLAKRSAYPLAVMLAGAFDIISTSAITAMGAVQGKVVLQPSFVMEAPKAIYPSIEAAVATTI